MNDARRFDLNLLVVLDALMAERNVTRAARRVGITQPAMSNALRRLRVVLADPVLVRVKGGMVATAKAERVGRAARALLHGVDAALDVGAEFDPATAKRELTVAASDYVATVLIPKLLPVLATEAPGISLRMVPLEPDLSLGKLEAGALDLTLGFFRHVPKSLRRLRLFTDDNVGVARRGHPILRTSPVSVEALAVARHVRIAPQGEPRGFLDVVLAKRGLRRDVVVTASQFMLAIAALEGGLVGVVPGRLGRVLAQGGGVQTFALPVALPTITVDAYWHARMQDDRAHAWLRKRIALAAGASPAPAPRAPAARKERSK